MIIHGKTNEKISAGEKNNLLADEFWRLVEMLNSIDFFRGAVITEHVFGNRGTE